jgi:hypothetical protein
MFAMPMPVTPQELAVTGTVLTAIAYLLIKHLLADFILQTANQRREKGTYGAWGGLTHSLTHIVFTAPVFLILDRLDVLTMATVLMGEFVLHYHIDWSKEQLVRRNNWQPHGTAFWWALGTDQLLHALTYIAIVWLLLQP